MIALILLLGCSSGASEPTREARTGTPMDGTVCEQLAELVGGDPWTRPGKDLPSDDEDTRTRVLEAVMPWAERCTVNRLGGMDVGVSCTRSGLDLQGARDVHDKLSAEFRSCHEGWTLTDESSGPTRELVAERGGSLRFLRMREVEGRWEVSTGAMPDS